MEVSRPIDLPFLISAMQAGFYRSTGQVVVLGESFDGTEPLITLCTWQGPANPTDTFTSPLVNFNNMHHMGGYAWRPTTHPGGVYKPGAEYQRLVERVASGQKPAAATGYLCVRWDSTGEENRLQAIERREYTKSLGLAVTRLYESSWGQAPRYAFGFARAGTLHENYDLAAWRDAWVAYGLDAAKVDGMVARYGDTTLIDLITTFEDDEYELPPHIRGLVLGFPLCTTIQYMGGRLWVD